MNKRVLVFLAVLILMPLASVAEAPGSSDRSPSSVFDLNGSELFGIGASRQEAEEALGETPDFVPSVLVEPSEDDLKFSPWRKDSIYRFVLFGSVQEWIPWGLRPQAIVYDCGISVTYDSSALTEIIQKYRDAEYASEDEERTAATKMIAEVDGYFLRDMPVLKIEILKHGFESISGIYVGMPLEQSVIGFYDDLVMYFFDDAELSEEYVRGADDTTGIICVTARAAHDGGFVERIVIDAMK